MKKLYKQVVISSDLMNLNYIDQQKINEEINKFKNCEEFKEAANNNVKF